MSEMSEMSKTPNLCNQEVYVAINGNIYKAREYQRLAYIAFMSRKEDYPYIKFEFPGDIKFEIIRDRFRRPTIALMVTEKKDPYSLSGSDTYILSNDKDYLNKTLRIKGGGNNKTRKTRTRKTKTRKTTTNKKRKYRKN